MGVLVPKTVPQLLSPLIVLVLQMHGNRHGARGSHRLRGRAYRHAGRVALGRGGHVGHRLGQDDLGLRHADPFHRLGRAHRHGQGLRVRISHVLGGADHDPPGDKLDILPGVEHPRQVIDRGVRIGPPHTLDKGRHRVVVVVPILVIAHHPLLDTLLRHRQIDMDLAVRSPLRGQNAQLHSV